MCSQFLPIPMYFAPLPFTYTLKSEKIIVDEMYKTLFLNRYASAIATMPRGSLEVRFKSTKIIN